jgi:GDP-4-dehydro-6-deoxy-D-mannose reductase
VKVAVSGVAGFVGRHLTRELVSHGHEVVGLSKGPSPAELEDLVAEHVEADLTAGWPDVSCDAVVHLAGLSAVGPSFEDPQRYLTENSAQVTHLCEQVLASGLSPRIVVVSTGAVYAPGVGLTEASPTVASSPYAVSKLLVETQCAYYRRRGLDITVMRPFNHLGPGQSTGFLLPDLLAGVRAATAEDRALTVGSLETRRDYTDVRDVVRAYRLAVEAERIEAPVLNVCSGVSVSGREMLELVAAALEVPVPPVEVDPRRLRPGDPPEIRGDASLIADLLGWSPSIDLPTTVRDTVAADLVDNPGDSIAARQ